MSSTDPTGNGPSAPVPVWPTALPGGPSPMDPKLKKSLDTMSLIMLIAGLVELAWCLYRLASQLIAGPFVKAYLGWLGSVAPKTSINSMIGPIDTFMQRIALAETIRTLPFLICTSVLVWLAIRVGRGDLRALGAVRRWCLFAFGAIAVSAAIQATVIVPATLAYTDELLKALPQHPTSTSGAPPFDVQGLTSSITIASTIFGAIFGVIMLSVLPIVLLVWAGKLRKRVASPQAS